VSERARERNVESWQQRSKGVRNCMCVCVCMQCVCVCVCMQCVCACIVCVHAVCVCMQCVCACSVCVIPGAWELRCEVSVSDLRSHAFFDEFVVFAALFPLLSLAFVLTYSHTRALSLLRSQICNKFIQSRA